MFSSVYSTYTRYSMVIKMTMALKVIKSLIKE